MVLLTGCVRVLRSTATPGTTCAWASCWRTWTRWPAALRSATGMVPPLRPVPPELFQAITHHSTSVLHKVYATRYSLAVHVRLLTLVTVTLSHTTRMCCSAGNAAELHEDMMY